MAACWQQLQCYAAADLFVLAQHADAEHNNAPFSANMLEGVPVRLLSAADARDRQVVRDEIVRQEPDVVAISGWNNPAYTHLPFDRALTHARFVMVMDTQWTGSLRQRLARLRHPAFFHRIDHVVVAGDRGRTMAREMGFEDASIIVGATYGVDHKAMTAAHAARSAAVQWPRAFVFVGQLVLRKGIDVLMQAYTAYRKAVVDPWDLLVCGQGPLMRDVERTPGVRALGFVQPSTLSSVLASSGALVLPSRSEPWGMAIVEACSAGLPIICTRACGASVELVRDGYNGIVISHASAPLLHHALIDMHGRNDELFQMGERSHELASAYSAEAWARKWVALLGRAS